MIATEPLTPESQEKTSAALRTYAVIAADFYRALIDQGFPADGATGLVAVWLDGALNYEEVDDE